MAQQLSVFAAVAEDTGLVPSTQVAAHNVCTLVLGDVMSTSGVATHRATHTCMQAKHAYTQRKNRSLELGGGGTHL